MRWERIRPHLDFLYDLARRETGHAQDAEDVVQEVTASALHKGEPKRVRAYLAGAVLRRARHVRRGHGRRRRREESAEPRAPDAGPERAAAVREEVAAALAALDDAERRAVTLRYLHDLDYADVARVLRTTEANARQRVRRGLERLRRRFGERAEAALALVPLFAAPRSLTAAAPVAAGAGVGAKATLVGLAFCAGIATSAATGAPEERAAPPAAAATDTPAAPLGDPRAEAAALRARLEAMPRLGRKDALVYGRDSLRRRILGIEDLPENERLETAFRLGKRIRETGDGVTEAIALLKGEEDPMILLRLGNVLRGRALAALPEATRDPLAKIAIEGAPAARRRAALAVAFDDGYHTARPAWARALRHVFEHETDAGVVRMASDVIVFKYFEGMQDALLKAARRMPAGEDRRWVVGRYARFAPGPDAIERGFDAARDDAERDDWAHAMAGFGLHSGDVAARVRRVYPRVPGPRARAHLLERSNRYGNAGLVRWLRDHETDRELRALLDGILAALERGDPLDPRVVSERLHRYGRKK